MKKYITEVVRELKKVTWPSKKQTIDKTIIVIVVSLLLAMYIGGLDYIFRNLLSYIINQLY